MFHLEPFEVRHLINLGYIIQHFCGMSYTTVVQSYSHNTPVLHCKERNDLGSLFTETGVCAD